MTMNGNPEATSLRPDEEIVDALPVPAGVGPSLARHDPGGQVVVRQAAAVAASSFVAGAVAVAAVRVVGGHRARRRRARALPVLATRSFLVDVHVLGSRR